MNQPRPLCVDLDGALVATDTLWESLLLLARRQPHALAAAPWWWLRGKAVLKREVADRAIPNPGALPYRPEVLALLDRAKKDERPVVLVTAAEQRVADAVAAHLGRFDEAVGSDGARNLKGEAKRALLDERYGAGGYDYVGDSAADLAVWRGAAEIYLAGASRRTERRVRRLNKPVHLLTERAGWLGATLRALRPHQWAKNLLLFVPLVLSHRWSLEAWAEVLLAFIAFGLCASAGYVLNDLFDLESDRLHETKRRRPFASGALLPRTGVLLAALTMGGGLLLSILVLPRWFSVALGGYVLLTAAYSAYFKRKLIVDVVLLALLFTYRVLAGGLAASVEVSFWLLAFSLFFFTGLAFAKRFAELLRLRLQGVEWAAGRKYGVADLATIRGVGSASGLISVLVFALYLNSAEVRILYERPQVLWLICPVLLYWITRVWFLAARNELHEDPVVFALTDRASYVAGLVTIACIIGAKW